MRREHVALHTYAHLELWVNHAFAHGIDVIKGVLCRAKRDKCVQLANLAKLGQVLYSILGS